MSQGSILSFQFNYLGEGLGLGGGDVSDFLHLNLQSELPHPRKLLNLFQRTVPLSIELLHAMAVSRFLLK